MAGFRVLSLFVALAWVGCGAQGAAASDHSQLVSKHAAAYGVPEALVRRVIHIESKGNPRVVSKGNYGLMQIRLGTARAMGYQGGAEGLLDADTNMTYAVKYLAGAYRAARGNHEQAIRNYQKGYYYQAKQQGFSPYTLASTVQTPVTQQAAAPVPEMVQEEAVRRQAAELQREATLQTQQRAAEAARDARRQALEQERVLRQQAIEQQRAAQRAAAERERAARVAAIESRRQAQREAAERRRLEQQHAREQRRAEQLQRAQASRAPTPAPSNANASAQRAAPAQSYSWYNPMRYFKHPSHQSHPYRPTEH